MNSEQLEQAVVDYLERREREPSLSPERFAAGFGEAREQVVAAIRTALELEAMFPDEGAPPRAIGPYQVVGEIGRGGMGIVYRATRSGRHYAIKLLPLAPIVGPRMLERFRREAGTLRQLSHPHIVHVHDTGMHEEMPYLVMDLVEGQPLQQMIGSLSLDQAIVLVEILAQTIDAAHRQGVLHRDLKPQNVLVRPDQSPVLLDFGLSVAEDFPTLTATGEIVGTPRYMAPEQVLARPVDARTDVYALGLILYELVLKKPARKESTRETLLDRVRRGSVPHPRVVDAAIPRELEKIMLTALARNPARRYPTAGAMAEDLARYRRGDPVVAKPPGRWIIAIEAARDRPARVAAVAGAAVLVLLICGLWLQSTIKQRAPLWAAPHINRAVVMWLDGNPTAAQRELARARRLIPRDPTVRLLGEHWARVPEPLDTPCLRAIQEGLRQFEAGAFTEVIAKLKGCGPNNPRPALVSAVVGLSALEANQLPLAAEELSVAARDYPNSIRVLRGLGRVNDRLRRYDDALRAYRAALEISDQPALVWADIAEVHFHQRDLEAGLAAIARADSLSVEEDPRILGIRAQLEIHLGRHTEGRSRLARLLELDPNDANARFQMGYSYDLEHDMVQAERAYRGVLTIDPLRVDALACLANLHAGASRGQCRGCDSVYAAHPEYHDLQKAKGYVLRALAADRGETEWIVHTTRDLALRIADRDSVIALLERLTSGSERTQAVLRLEDMLRRLRLAGG